MEKGKNRYIKHNFVKSKFDIIFKNLILHPPPQNVK